jgi:predicted secreted Zn-dependent protease
MTEWEVSAGYRPVAGANTCGLTGLTVEVVITTHLPRWDRSTAAPESLSNAWDRFLHALTEHEDGHRALAKEAADVIRQRLLAATAPACERLDLVAQREMAAVMQEYEVRNHAYDAATGHGRTQGAIW